MGLKSIESWAMYKDTQPKEQRSWEFDSMEKMNHTMVVRNALFLFFLIIYFVNNFLIVHPYDVSAFKMSGGLLEHFNIIELRWINNTT